MDKTNETTSVQTRMALARALTRIRDLKGQLERQSPAPIAIVGAAGRFPGAPNLKAFWKLCAEGRCAITEIPPSRFDTDGVPARAGLLERVDTFDHVFFGMSPAEARMMDPQHRLLLEVSRDAFDAACIPPARHAAATGMFVGIMNSDYREFALQEADTYTGTGNTACFSAGRISHLLGLHGPSLCLDTACSSSLVTVHLACQSLRAKEVDLALAGGASLILSRSVMELTARTGALSATGQSTIFDERANGYVRGEGCAMVVLKRLDDALRDGNPVLAVIRGSAVNHDGRSSTLTAPSPKVQEMVVRRALKHAGVRPEEVGYIEAHGTGTSIGDPIELDGLARVLSMASGCDDRCYLGSGKANIGHLEAAAGVTGLLRAVGALRSGTIYPQANFKTLNPRISLRGSTLGISQKARPWPSQGPRIAGVSAFGMSGTNAHVVLQQAPERSAPKPAPEGLYDDLLAVSAHSRPALEALLESWRGLAAAHPWRALCRAAACRASLEQRAVVRLQPEDNLNARFAQALCQAQAPQASDLRLALVFGERSNINDASRARLLKCSPAFQRAFEDVRNAAQERHQLDILAPQRADHPALALALQLGMAEHARELGMAPVEVIGAGTGALAAGVVAGAWSMAEALDKAVRLVLTHALELPAAQKPELLFKHVRAFSAAEVQEANVVVGMGLCHPQEPLEMMGHRQQRLDTVASLFERGVLATWGRVVKGDASAVMPPAYPWQRQSHWVGQAPQPSSPRDWCHRLIWQPHMPTAPSAERLRTVLVFGGGTAQTAAVVDRLQGRAQHVVVVSQGQGLSVEPSGERATLRAQQREDLVGLVRRVTGAFAAPVERIVVLPDFGDPNGIARRHLVTTLAQAADVLDCAQWFVTQGAIEPTTELAARVEAPLWGLLRAHFFESGVTGGLIDLGQSQAMGSWQWLEAVVSHAARPAQLRVAHGEVQQAVIALDPPQSAGPLNLSAEGAYLVTGGTGGIGRRFVDWLIRRGARRVVVTSRRTPSESVKDWMEAAARQGAEIIWEQADASVPAQMRRALERIGARGLLLRGVGHAAGVGTQVPVKELDDAEYTRVCGAKIDGGWCLHGLTQGMALDFFLTFSSISSVLAGRGQAAYSAANNGLDALVAYRRSKGLVGTSVRWGLWDGEGIPDEEERRRIEGLGLSAMDGEAALDLLDALLVSAPAAPIVASMRWKTCLRFLDPAGQDPLLEQMRQTVAPSRQSAPEQTGPRSADDARQIILTHIARHIDANPESVPLERSLMHIGLDSLGAYALKGSLEDAGIAIEMESLLDGSTVEDLIRSATAAQAPKAPQAAPVKPEVATKTTKPAAAKPARVVGAGAFVPKGVDRGWFVRQTANPKARHRLICFPYAGGSPSVFAGWAGSLPPEIELRALQLPARSARLREAPVHRMDALVESLLEAYTGLEPMPTAFFGHCFGALMMFELTQRLRREGLELPTHLFVSAARSPQSYTRAQLLADVEQFSPQPPLQLPQLDDDTLVSALTEMRFADTVEALEKPELRQLLLPAVRADFEISNNYFYEAAPPLPMPIFAMGGRADGYVTALQLLSWGEHTTGGFAHEYCSGGHYFIAENQERWTSRIASMVLGS